MPKKPTKDFGYVSFSPDGRVKKEIFRLPDSKAAQELEVARRFASLLGPDESGKYEVVPLPENDHDFVLQERGTSIKMTVQLAEIVARDYLVRLTEDQYRNGTPGFTKYVVDDGTYCGVDVEKRDSILTERIKQKLARHYQKPDGSLWLVLWSLNSDFTFVYCSGGKFHKAPAIIMAERYIGTAGSHPFDAIWFFNPLLAPYRLLSR